MLWFCNKDTSLMMMKTDRQPQKGIQSNFKALFKFAASFHPLVSQERTAGRVLVLGEREM